MEIESSGMLIVDKPAGITSAKVVALLKEKAGLHKAGHTGTLDPFATGVLICCVNQATRLARFFLNGNKKYQGTLLLGTETDTLDMTGKVIATCDHFNFPEGHLHSVFRRFVGEMDQVPPVYSALKHNGVRLYKLARKGRPVQKAARRVMISSLEILQIDLPKIDFEVACSAGTYIRTLCADIGRDLGCGSHLQKLRRIESCGFTINQSVTLEEIEMLASQDRLKDSLISMNDAIRAMKGMVADEVILKKILYGKPIMDSDLSGRWIEPETKDRYNGFIKIIDIKNNLLAVLDTHKKNGPYDYCCVFHP
jgi:tRNA pseudouridine55 synthase